MLTTLLLGKLRRDRGARLPAPRMLPGIERPRISNWSYEQHSHAALVTMKKHLLIGGLQAEPTAKPACNHQQYRELGHTPCRQHAYAIATKHAHAPAAGSQPLYVPSCRLCNAH